MNDTGSTILTLFDVDVLHLGNIQGYAGWAGPVVVSNADGVMSLYPTIRMQIQLVRDDNSPWSEWINEEAIVRPVGLDIPRLSGIRDIMYMATAPGNHVLAVSTTKGELTSLLL